MPVNMLVNHMNKHPGSCMYSSSPPPSGSDSSSTGATSPPTFATPEEYLHSAGYTDEDLVAGKGW